MPATVHAMLAARIDRLPEYEKQVLQTAAVIGRTFPRPYWPPWPGGRRRTSNRRSTALCDAEFLQQETAWPAPEYRFWHALTRDVAYGTLLSGRRARLHAGVAQALAELDPARQDERAALVANHYAAAGSHLEAAPLGVPGGAGGAAAGRGGGRPALADGARAVGLGGRDG